jgi:exodeoxyribonuclease VII small subunit
VSTRFRHGLTPAGIFHPTPLQVNRATFRKARWPGAPPVDRVDRLQSTCKSYRNLHPDESRQTVSRKTAKTVDFEASMAELEGIVERLEQGDLSLEESLAPVRARRRPHPQLRGGPQEAEQKVKVLGPARERSRDSRTSSPRPAATKTERGVSSNPAALGARLELYRQRVEAALDRFLPPASRPARTSARGDALCGAGPRQADPSRAVLPDRRGPRRRRRDARRPGGGGGADPCLLAGPRRPAGHGRRRPAARPAHHPSGLRRGHRDSRRRCPAGAGLRDPRH